MAIDPTPHKLPRSVVMLGLVSLTLAISSEMIHALLPLFLVTVLGASVLSVSIIEGIAEATAAIAKVFSGAISDWLGRRKPLLLLGYGLAALTKPLFPPASGIGEILIARFLDRIGKGGSALWGLHMGATQGIMTAIVASAAPHALERRNRDIRHRARGGWFKDRRSCDVAQIDNPSQPVFRRRLLQRHDTDRRRSGADARSRLSPPNETRHALRPMGRRLDGERLVRASCGD